MTYPAKAAREAFEVWRNRPGRADPRMVMEALIDAATRAYAAARDDATAERPTGRQPRKGGS